MVEPNDDVQNVPDEAFVKAGAGPVPDRESARANLSGQLARRPHGNHGPGPALATWGSWWPAVGTLAAGLTAHWPTRNALLRRSHVYRHP
jgi:hypothetical protein